MDLQDATVRLDELSNMRAGWLDGDGEVPTPEGIDWLKSSFEDKFDVGLELPYLFLTEEGHVQAEWDLAGGWAFLTIDTGNRSGELVVLKTGDELASIESQIDLESESDGWVRIRDIIRSLDGTAGEA